MTMTFLRSSSYLQTAESVTEGHPDKLCDQVSDAVLDAIMASDPEGRVACETATTTGLVVVMGEITTGTYVDIGRLVREVVRDVGYTNADYGFDYQTCGVMVSIKEQSQDIAAGVDVAYEVRGEGGDDGIERLGAGDQGIMVGYACNETPELMPMPISLSHRLARRLAEVRKEGTLPYLRPDGKSQVVIEYDRGEPVRLANITLAAQHDPEVSNEALERDLTELVIRPTVPRTMLDNRTTTYVNASGRFVTGGPMGDAGLTGRKILVDTYGGGSRHGGGAFSGKDPTKVDRSAAYAARYVAKNVVAAGLADRCELQLAYVIGMATPISIAIETYGTGTVGDDIIERLIRQHFDLRPGAIIRDLDLRRPIYRQVASYGHFGRPDLDLPWESTDKAEILQQDAGIRAMPDRGNETA
jgi:S-adenosylmethionine synthetase